MINAKKRYITADEKKQFREAMQNISLPDRAVAQPVFVDRIYIKDTGLTDQMGGADPVFYQAPGLQKSRANRFRHGKIGWQDTLDLHGDDRVQARRKLEDFLSHAYAANMECVLLIHGKGKHGTQGASLKNRITAWLRNTEQVLAYCSALPRDGGTGALYVLLKRR